MGGYIAGKLPCHQTSPVICWKELQGLGSDVSSILFPYLSSGDQAILLSLSKVNYF